MVNQRVTVQSTGGGLVASIGVSSKQNVLLKIFCSLVQPKKNGETTLLIAKKGCVNSKK